MFIDNTSTYVRLKALFKIYVLKRACFCLSLTCFVTVVNEFGTLIVCEREEIMENKQNYTYQPIVPGSEYYDLEHRSEIRDGARKLRKQYLRYKEAEIIYSMSHKKLLELAGEAGAIFRMDGTVLIKRDIFDSYLEQFREESTLTSGRRHSK